MKAIKIVLVLANFAALSISFFSCESTVTNNNTPTPPDNFQLNVWDYSERHYFVDTLYKRSFTEFYKDSITSYTNENEINLTNNYFELWVQCNATESQKRFCVGKVMLGPRPPQGYDTSVTNPEIIASDKFAGYFRKLYASEYYVYSYAGFIGFKINLPENYSAGVVYRTKSNNIFGKGSFESNSEDTLILKLIKFGSPSPVSTPVAWNLMMKNVYKIPYTNLQSSSTIKTMFNANNVYRDTITGYNIPLITMLKLDRFNNGTNLPPPDGRFDWLTGKTIIPSTGEIIFPILEPFGKGIKDYGFDSTYIFWEMYSQKKSNVQQSPKANLYIIKGIAVYN